MIPIWCDHSLRKQQTFGDVTTGFLPKWCLRKEHRNSILMMCHYPDLGGASDWLNQISHAARPIRSTTPIWVMTYHQYRISALISQTSFGRETSDDIAKCRLFPQAKVINPQFYHLNKLGRKMRHAWKFQYICMYKCWFSFFLKILHK